jgi:acyl-CoA thioesterase FadM
MTRSRDQLELPGDDQFIYSTEIAVRVSDVNYANHLSHVAVLDLIQEARLRWLKEHGLEELDVGGAGLIITDVVVIYRSEAHHGDVLTIEVALADQGDKGFDTLYRVTNRRTEREVARAKVGFLFYDYRERRVVEAPERFRAAFDDVER